MSSSLPASVRQVALFLERLPGIGQKTANRLAFYILRMPERDLQSFAENIAQLKAKTKRCSVCNNLTEDPVCSICANPERDHGTITVVEDVVDLLSFETGNIYQGVYHVLHGKIDPLNHIGPEDIFIDSLLTRIRRMQESEESPAAPLSEVILAMNPDMEGEATAMYLRNALNEIRSVKQDASDESGTGTSGVGFRITRLGYGLPIGGNLEYADYMTLRKAFENRSSFQE